MLRDILNKTDLDFSNVKYLLNLSSESDLKVLFKKATEIKHSVTSTDVYLRGLIEISNICTKNCYYCGIRSGNTKKTEFKLSSDEILKYAKISYDNKILSLVLQAGERSDKDFVLFIENTLSEIKKLTDNKLKITLSLGEQTEETYQRWFDAGAHRYILRVETTNPKLYSQIHPKTCSLEKRIECLKLVRKIGYHVGTGVLIGFPGQTVTDLANDLMFYKEIDIDMIGMGPYIPHKDTPMGEQFNSIMTKVSNQKNMLLGLKMIAVARILLKDVNIASTTALETLSSSGLEQGIKAGGNIIMPNVTDAVYKKSYSLYDNKPCSNDSFENIVDNLNKRMLKCGEKIIFDEWGDPVHFIQRTKL